MVLNLNRNHNGLLRTGNRFRLKSKSTFCFTSTEVRWFIRDGDRGWGGGERVSGSTVCTDQEDRGGPDPPPEQPKC